MANFSTAPYTRSLSVALTDILLPLYPSTESTNSTLLYYENPSGKVSALLRQTGLWVDITSQDSVDLPNEFRNTPTSGSHTLYESAETTMPGSPFACGANWTSLTLERGIGAIFFSLNASENSVGSRFTYNEYTSDSSGPGIFYGGMHYTPLTPYDYR